MNPAAHAPEYVEGAPRPSPAHFVRSLAMAPPVPMWLCGRPLPGPPAPVGPACAPLLSVPVGSPATAGQGCCSRCQPSPSPQSE
ncbi:unnamed protein product [Amoebophrya sp. A120]|nr:unnamed protein product [Amoebophrya sp. A120]|eukprot:GSA120T00021142001.1